MYECMKILIERRFYKTSEDAKTKLDVFYKKNRLTDEEYNKLSHIADLAYCNL